MKLADEFWNIYIKHAIAEVEAIEIIINKINNTKDIYAIFDREMPYRKAIKISKNTNVKYLIFKSRRECYDVRIISDSNNFKNKIVKVNDINKVRKSININDLIYIDTHGKLCCTKSLESAIKLIEYNEKI